VPDPSPKIDYESKTDIEREPPNWGMLVAAIVAAPVVLAASILFGVAGALVVVALVLFFLFLRSRKGV